MKKIPIFFTFDDNYVVPAAVAFESLLANAIDGIFYDLYVIHTKVTDANQELLTKIVNSHGNGALSFIDVTNKFDFEFNDQKFRSVHAGAVFTVETLYRCCPMLISEFTQYDKIIYSDVDIVVVSDISELWSIELGESYLAGVNVPAFLKEERTHLDPKFEGCYVSGGIWVMNLKKMREDNLGRIVLGLIEDPPFRLIWQDQDIINIACDCNVKFLPYIYISIPTWFTMLAEKDFWDEYYPSGELYDAMYRPKIVHYAGAKPWNDRQIHKADLWYYWLGKTPFAGSYAKFEYLERSYVYRVYLLGFIKIFAMKGRFVKNKLYSWIGAIPFIKVKRSIG